MSHIFISYSHKDSKYVEKLEKKLIEEGFNVWIDKKRIRFADAFPESISKAIDTCEAFIVVVSGSSSRSEWVEREIIHAEESKKPIFPLFLKGRISRKTRFLLGNIHHLDVRDGSLPPKVFYENLPLGAKSGFEIINGNEDGGTEVVSFFKRIWVNAKGLFTKAIKSLSKSFIVKITGIVFFIVITVISLKLGFPSIRAAFWPTSTATPTSTPTITITPSSTATKLPASTVSRTPTLTFTPTITLTPTLTSTPTPLPLSINDSKGVKMILIPSGDFIIGYDNGVKAEKPQNTRHVDTFYIDKYEVTNSHYTECVEAKNCIPPYKNNSSTRSTYFGNPKYNDYPVIYVDWYMAKNYCEWRDARLPTEPEWEKAARGTDGRLYPWGNRIDYTFANYSNYVGDTTKVGSYEIGKSVYGVYDMSGNVSEWTNSLFYYYPYKTKEFEDDNNVLTPRVTRGGDWRSDSVAKLRASYREGYNLYYQGKLENYDFLGFRCARSIGP